MSMWHLLPDADDNYRWEDARVSILENREDHFRMGSGAIIPPKLKPSFGSSCRPNTESGRQPQVCASFTSLVIRRRRCPCTRKYGVVAGLDAACFTLQAPNAINLQLHANGTYRACWADRLGF